MNLPATLEDSVREFARGAEAPATRRAYRADFRIFTDWCLVHEAAPLPAVPVMLAAFLTDQAKAGINVATINRRLAAIVFIHRATGRASPADETVRRVLKGIRRELGVAARPKTPLTVDLIHQIVDAMPGWALRDRSLILLGFAGAFRRSELAGLLNTSIVIVPAGALVMLTRSKTDQEGEGQTVAIVRAATLRYCPVFQLEQWLAVHHEPRVYPVSGGYIGLIVKRWAEHAGIDPVNVGAHSLRSGFITSASLAGSPRVSYYAALSPPIGGIRAALLPCGTVQSTSRGETFVSSFDD